MSPEFWEISAQIYWTKDSVLPSRIQQEGEPARSCVKVLAHAWQGTRKVSLASVRIITGRQHQIRVCTAHVHHPTVCDGKYTAAATFLSDRQFCPQNFLHRYRLAFTNDAGAVQEFLAPVPLDLIEVVETLEPTNSQSAEWLQHFTVVSESN